MYRFYCTCLTSRRVKEEVLRTSSGCRNVHTSALYRYAVNSLQKEKGRKVCGCRTLASLSSLLSFLPSSVVSHRRHFALSSTVLLHDGKKKSESTTESPTSTTSAMSSSSTAVGGKENEKTLGSDPSHSTLSDSPTSTTPPTSTSLPDPSTSSTFLSSLRDTVKEKMDLHTKITGFGGTYAMTEKAAALQEKTFSFTPPANFVSSVSSCCSPASRKKMEADHFSDATSRCFHEGDIAPPDSLKKSVTHEKTVLSVPHVPRPIMPAPLLPRIAHQEVAAQVEEAMSSGVSAAASNTSASSSSSSASLHAKRSGGLSNGSIEEILAKRDIESIKGSSALKSRPKGSSHRGVQRLLDYNKQWAAEVSRFNPTYFSDLASEQKPEYFWIGCSDSRVPANEIVGLHPGDVFVHRNIGNIFSLSDLNCLSALQFAVDSLKVEHVIVAGHYKCGGVTAAMQNQKLGLTEHWIMQVTDIKNRWWQRIINEVPECDHLNVLCELNVIEQLYHAVSCCVIQRRWKQLDALEKACDMDEKSQILVRDSYAKHHPIFERNHCSTTARVFSKIEKPVDVEVHGWVYGLDDGLLRPLLRITRHCNIEKVVNDAREAVFVRYALC